MSVSLRKNDYTHKIQALHSADSRSWWQQTKQFLHLKHFNPVQNLYQEDPTHSLADKINEFFISVSAHLPPFDDSVLDSIIVEYTDEYIIEPAYVKYQLSCINIHKAPGPDGLPNWLLKDFAPLICDPVAAIFKASVREGYVPCIWKSAEVIPTPKINPPTSIQNDLRPISLLPTLAKVLEKKNSW